MQTACWRLHGTHVGRSYTPGVGSDCPAALPSPAWLRGGSAGSGSSPWPTVPAYRGGLFRRSVSPFPQGALHFCSAYDGSGEAKSRCLDAASSFSQHLRSFRSNLMVHREGRVARIVGTAIDVIEHSMKRPIAAADRGSFFITGQRTNG